MDIRKALCILRCDIIVRSGRATSPPIVLVLILHSLFWRQKRWDAIIYCSAVVCVSLLACARLSVAIFLTSPQLEHLRSSEMLCSCWELTHALIIALNKNRVVVLTRLSSSASVEQGDDQGNSPSSHTYYKQRASGALYDSYCLQGTREPTACLRKK